MSRHFHVGLSVRGALKNGAWRDELVGCCTGEDGRVLTAAEIFERRAKRLLDRDDLPSESRDDAELFLVLARVLEGKPVDRAFGAPGDWGYGTEIGDALAKVYQTAIRAKREP